MDEPSEAPKMTKTGFLARIAEFCNQEKKSDFFNTYDCIKNKKKVILTKDTKSIDASLCNWIEESSERILVKTIPDDFWSDHDLPKPTKLSELCPKSHKEPSQNVLLVVLWSWCSPDCSENITDCFRSGSRKWQVDNEYGVTDWLGSFVKCVWASVAYARQEIQKKAIEVGGLEEFTKYTTVLNACALRQAVCNSSKWFSILTLKQSSDVFIRSFIKIFLKKGILHAKFRGPMDNLAVFSDTDSSAVDYVSVEDWFKKFIIVPILENILKLAPMTKLVREFESIQGKENQEDVKKACQTLGDNAAKDLHLESEDYCDKEHYLAGLLCAFAYHADNFVKNRSDSAAHEKNLLEVMSRYPALVAVSTGAKDVNYLLKQMMSSKRPVFNHETVSSTISVWGDIPNVLPSNTKGTAQHVRPAQRATSTKNKNKKSKGHLPAKEKRPEEEPTKEKVAEAAAKAALEEKASRGETSMGKGSKGNASKGKGSKGKGSKGKGSKGKGSKGKASEGKSTGGKPKGMPNAGKSADTPTRSAKKGGTPRNQPSSGSDTGKKLQEQAGSEERESTNKRRRDDHIAQLTAEVKKARTMAQEKVFPKTVQGQGEGIADDISNVVTKADKEGAKEKTKECPKCKLEATTGKRTRQHHAKWCPMSKSGKKEAAKERGAPRSSPRRNQANKLGSMYKEQPRRS